MPHNRTRIWVGVAIIAVTIPAVGTYYTHAAATDDLKGLPISVASQPDSASRRQNSTGSGRTALRRPPRDYQSEVDAALARQGVYPDRRFAEDGNYSTYDDLFDDDPFMDSETDRLGMVSMQDVPNQTALLASPDSNPVAYSTDGPVVSGRETSAATASLSSTPVAANRDAVSSEAAPVAVADYSANGTLSDSDVYRLVVNGLAAGQREDFLRSYATMSAEQRANLLDGFRQQLQGGQ